MYLTLIRKIYVYSRGDFIYFSSRVRNGYFSTYDVTNYTVKPSLLPLSLPPPPPLAYYYYIITITLLIYYVSLRCRPDVLRCKFVNITQLSNCILTVNRYLYTNPRDV